MTAAVVLVLGGLVVLGLAVEVLGLPRWRVERYTISIREMPNVAAPLPVVTAERHADPTFPQVVGLSPAGAEAAA